MSGSALISGEAEIGGYARVRDRAIVTGGTVQENALVCGEAVVRKNVSTESVPLVEGHATVMGNRGRCRLPGSGCLYPAGKHSG